MDFDETWQVGLRPKKTNSLARFHAWVSERALKAFFVTCTTHHFCHFPWIDFRQTSDEHVSMWWLVTNGFTFQKFPQRGRFPEKPSF